MASGKRISILENTVKKREEKVRGLEKIMKPYQTKIKHLEDYAITNHHKWSRERILEESQRLTDVCIELDEWEVKYNDAKRWLDVAIYRLKKAKEISKGVKDGTKKK